MGTNFTGTVNNPKSNSLKRKKKKWLNGADNNTAVYNNASETEQENGT